MPQLTTVVLKDSLNADHTFTPESGNGDSHQLVESNGVPIGDRRIIISSAQQSKTGGRRRKVGVRLVLPVVQDATVNGVSRPTVVRSSFVNIEFSFDQASTVQERADTLAFVEGLAQNAMLEEVVSHLRGLF